MEDECRRAIAQTRIARWSFRFLGRAMDARDVRERSSTTPAPRCSPGGGVPGFAGRGPEGLRDGATFREAVGYAAALLAAAGCEHPDKDAQAVVAYAGALSAEDLLGSADDPFPSERGPALSALLRRRIEREPLEYILGRCRFYGVELVVDPRVMVPREDRTGLLVRVGEDLPGQSRVHEVGTGSGAVALALKQRRPDLMVTGSDVSPAATEVAQANAERLRLDVGFFTASNLPAGDYDLVLANLPYSAEGKISTALPPELAKHQPPVALVAGADGFAAIRRFLATAAAGTNVALEHAPEQASTVRDLLASAHTLQDDAGEERVTTGIVL